MPRVMNFKSPTEHLQISDVFKGFQREKKMADIKQNRNQHSEELLDTTTKVKEGTWGLLQLPTTHNQHNVPCARILFRITEANSSCTVVMHKGKVTSDSWLTTGPTVKLLSREITRQSDKGVLSFGFGIIPKAPTLKRAPSW